MPVTYIMAGLENSEIQFDWEFDSDTIHVSTVDGNLHYGEASFPRANLIECLETVLADLKGDQ